jgi:predicted transport protein
MGSAVLSGASTGSASGSVPGGIDRSHLRPKHEAILVYLKVDPDTVELEEGFSRDMRGIGHLGTGDLEVRIASAADLEKAEPLIRRAFEAA